jgi:hypothetical protein
MGSWGGSPIKHYISCTNIAIRALYLPGGPYIALTLGKDEEETCHQCGKHLPYEAMRGRDWKLSRGYEYGKIEIAPFAYLYLLRRLEKRFHCSGRVSHALPFVNRQLVFRRGACT